MEMTHPTGTLRPAPADMAAVAAARGSASAELAAGMVPGISPGVASASAGMRLADLAIGAVARVVSVSSLGPSGSIELGRRLAELGFLPGERLRIVARGLMGREPIAVRIGTGTFALRLFEAACVRVCPEQSLLR
jgi:ferrous iron transport protein A